MRPFWISIFFSLTLTPSWAVLSAKSLPSNALDIKTSIGTFRGIANQTDNLEIWRGIPFAQPPVGNLRFKAPVSITTPFKDIQDASQFGAACPQPSSSSLGNVPISEDCLMLNVFRPSGTTSGDKLPVLVWMYGGTYNIGAASDPTFNPTFLINRSLQIGKPIIFVSLNYRINTFGFLANSLMAPEDLNAGLLDQRAAFMFVQNEIAAFGGDPEKSAGGGSVEAHVVFPAQVPLFRAGIADSSAGPL
ncbi:hypothetical protein Clacol_002388 [Clathrus columnatus]|uniref:Carboxylesterase type B domain-containing protein n=1 Tax=Clathrus columnatus TaxID=1419009 RepID=A0AAV5A5B7_9AGAM|nr:hypothetical protein Clacol_002388 [Clathrus columnatus]